MTALQQDSARQLKLWRQLSLYGLLGGLIVGGLLGGALASGSQAPSVIVPIDCEGQRST